MELSDYVNRSNVAVPGAFGAARLYVLFRTMGLRHVPIVDAHNRCIGMVTRKELLEEHLRRRIADG